MSFVSRAARRAALLLLSFGLIGASAPVLASDLTAGTVPVVATAPLPPIPAATPLDPASTPAGPAAPIATTSAAKAQFASLADAVAAQDGLAEDEHLRCLASAIYYESKGEPLAGQLAVAQVILNRTRSGRFASDVCGVVTQRGQFSFVRGGAIPPVDASRAAYRTAVAVARVAMQEAWAPAAGDALYFNGRNAGHGGSRRVAVIGGHAFYR